MSVSFLRNMFKKMNSFIREHPKESRKRRYRRLLLKILFKGSIAIVSCIYIISVYTNDNLVIIFSEIRVREALSQAVVIV